MKNIGLIILIILIFPALCLGAETEYSIFGSETYLPVKEKGFLEFVTGGENYFYEIGGKFSHYFDNGLTFTTQVSKHGKEDTGLDYMILRYSDYLEDFSYKLDIGKIEASVGLMSKGRLNPKTRWSIILPQAMYSNAVKRYANGGWGISFTSKFDIGKWKLSLQNSFYKPDNTQEEQIVHALFGPTGEGEYETGYSYVVNTELANITRNYIFYYTFAYSFNGEADPGKSSILPPSLAKKIDNKTYDHKQMLNQAGFQLNKGDFSWIIEARYFEYWDKFWEDMKLGSKHQTGTGANTAARYWFGEDIVATILGFGVWTDKAFDWNGEEKADETGANPSSHYQKDLYSTIVYKLNRNIDLKLEYHRMWGSAFVNGESNNMLNTVPDEWDFVATQLSFSF